MILPAVARYISEIAGAASASASAGISSKVLIDEVKNFDSIYSAIKDGITIWKIHCQTVKKNLIY